MPTVLEVAPGVLQLDAHYVRPQFVSCFLVRGQTSCAVVETGHVHAVPRILQGLDEAGIPRSSVSHVVVTHVHLDHAGGAGSLMRELPQATLVAHPRGARHLVDPAKLWAGTIGVYGEALTRKLYGDPVPVPAARVVEAPDGYAIDLGARRLSLLDAPGHARHHLVVLDEATRGFFSGDCFGVSYREADGGAGPFFFPTTTPVQFDPPALHQTVDRMMSERPERMYLTHFGMVEGGLERHAAALHRAIDAFVRVGQAAPQGEQRHAAIKTGLSQLLLEALAAHGGPLVGEAALRFFDGDLELNAAGLEAWLDSSKPRG